MYRSWKFIAPLLLVAIALSGCVALEEKGDEPITVGALIPLSGEGAVYGVPLQRVAQIAIKEINDAGGVLGKPFEFSFEDGGCNAESANRAIQKLVNVDKVKVVFGGFCSSETLAAAPVTEPAKVVLLSPGSSSPDITKAGDFVFRNYPSDSSQGKVLASYAEGKGYKKVGVLSEQQDYTLGIKQVFESEFDGEVVSETYTSDASDLRTQILKLKGESVDAYFVNPQTVPKTDLILKQLEEQGVTGPFLLNDVAIGFSDNVKKYATLLEGAVGAEATYDRANPGVTALQDTYKAQYNEELPYLPYMTTSYDAVYILKEAIEAVGNAEDSEKIRDYLYSLKDRKGLAGSLTIDANGDPLAGHILRAVKGGAVEDYVL